LSTTAQCSKLLPIQHGGGQIEKLLRDEETKLKKYDEDHKKK